MLLYIFSIILLVVAVALLIIAILFALPMFQGAPFVPTSRKKLATMIALAAVKPGEQAADLGSGSGRIVIALTRAGAEAHGYEINPTLVWWSRLQIWRQGLRDRAFIHRANLWTTDLSAFSVITVFGVPPMMQRLASKLDRELASGARVVSNGFSLPGWSLVKKDNQVLLYIKKF